MLSAYAYDLLHFMTFLKDECSLIRRPGNMAEVSSQSHLRFPFLSLLFERQNAMQVRQLIHGVEPIAGLRIDGDRLKVLRTHLRHSLSLRGVGRVWPGYLLHPKEYTHSL